MCTLKDGSLCISMLTIASAALAHARSSRETESRPPT